MPSDDTQSQSTMPEGGKPAAPTAERLVTVESQREFDLLTGTRSERTFLKLYVEARTSGLLAAISDRDWKTLCTLATYMDEQGYCFPSQAELARSLGCSRQMANERIKSLAAFRFQDKPVLLVSRAGRSEGGTWSRNGYHVLPIANLGIFNDAPPRDRRKSAQPTWLKQPQSSIAELPREPLSDAQQRPTPVSRSLDTAESTSRDLDTVSRRPMSNPTVPVQLDTNQTHIQNQMLNLSNIRKVNMLGKRGFSGGTPDQVSVDAVGVGESALTTDPRIRTTGFAPLSETLSKRRVRGSGDGTQATPLAGDPDRDVILEYIVDWSRELGDRAPLKSSTTRAYNLYQASEVPLETFIEGMYRARAIVKEHTASIRGERRTGDSTPSNGAKNKMAYWFTVLEDLLGLRHAPAGDSPKASSS